MFPKIFGDHVFIRKTNKYTKKKKKKKKKKNKNKKKRHANANDMENMQKSVIRESTTN